MYRYYWLTLETFSSKAAWNNISDKYILDEDGVFDISPSPEIKSGDTMTDTRNKFLDYDDYPYAVLVRFRTDDDSVEIFEWDFFDTGVMISIGNPSVDIDTVHINNWEGTIAVDFYGTITFASSPIGSSKSEDLDLANSLLKFDKKNVKITDRVVPASALELAPIPLGYLNRSNAAWIDLDGVFMAGKNMGWKSAPKSIRNKLAEAADNADSNFIEKDPPVKKLKFTEEEFDKKINKLVRDLEKRFNTTGLANEIKYALID